MISFIVGVLRLTLSNLHVHKTYLIGSMYIIVSMYLIVSFGQKPFKLCINK